MGFDLLLTGPHEHNILETKKTIEERYPQCRVKLIVLDLGRPEAIRQLQPVVDSMNIGLCILNHTAVYINEFVDGELDRMLNVIRINADGYTMISHLFAKSYINRRRPGGIVLLTSMASQGIPLISMYSSTKAFQLALGRILYYELRRHRIDVTTVILGATSTTNFEKAFENSTAWRFVKPLTKEDAVVESLNALGKTVESIPGFLNKLAFHIFCRLFPRKLQLTAYAGGAPRPKKDEMKEKNS